MFEQSFSSRGETRRTWSVLVAFAGQLLAIAILLASPLFFIEAPPVSQFTAILLAPAPPPPPPPPAAPAQASAPRETRATPRKFEASQLIAPKAIPNQVATIKDLEVIGLPSVAGGVIGGVSGGVPGGVPGGVVGGVIGGLPIAAPAPVPPPPPQKEELQKPPERIRIGGNVQAALLIHEVQPEYPAYARHAHITGTVRMTAIVSRDGTVQSLVLVSGPVLLVQAAMDAVKQWVYKPTYLNGLPVEVLTEVTLHFSLAS